MEFKEILKEKSNIINYELKNILKRLIIKYMI